MEKTNEESNNQNDTVSTNKKLWNRFNNEFWVLFFIHIIIKALITQNSENTSLMLFLIGLQLLVALTMVWRVGYHSYLFSGKKLYLLKGLLGLFWFGVIGIFLAYFIVKLDYYKAIKKPLDLRVKIVVGFSIIWISLFVITMIYSVYNQTDDLSIAQNEWVKVVSRDEHFSVSLPSNYYEFLQDDSPNSVYGYSYTANEYDGSVLYIVKYQDYQSVYDSEGIESLSSSNKLNFLRELANTELDELNVVEFSSELIKVSKHDAVRYNGVVHENGGTMNIEGVIIVVNKASYTVVVLYNPEYNHNLERVLDSLVIK